jgi:RHS repeat-associated protein
MQGSVTWSDYTWEGTVFPGWTFNQDFFATITLGGPGAIATSFPSNDGTYTYFLTGECTALDGGLTASGAWIATGTVPASDGYSAQTIMGTGTFSDGGDGGIIVGPGPSGISGDPAALMPVDQSKLIGLFGPVDPGTGAENFYRTLIALSGLRGLDFTVNYNSVQVGAAADLGFGWSHPYLASAQAGTDSFGNATVAIQWTQNHANTYTAAGSSGSSFKSTDQSAVYDVLTATGGGYILTKPDQTTYTFAASPTTGLAYLTQMANRFGQVLNVVRDSSGTKLLSIAEPVSAASLNFTYVGGNITKIADSAGRTVSLHYDANGNLVGIVDVNGNTVSYAYDSNHRLTTVTAADGSLIYANTYDSLGRVASQTDGLPGNPAATFSYDETSQPGNVVTTVKDHTGAQTIYVYDASYLLQSVTDPLGGVTAYSYDTNGDLVGITDALGRSSSFTYDANGNLLIAVDAARDQTAFTYDANHNVLSIQNAAGSTATLSYDVRNNPTQVVDFSGNKTVRSYSANSLLSQETSPRGNVISYGYTNGRLTSVTDPYSNKTTFAYDAAGRMTSAVDPTGATGKLSYTASGRILSQTDPLGNMTAFTYDVRDRLVSATDPVGGVTTRSYDANSNLLLFTDALKGVRKFAYDGENRITKATDPLGNASSYAYDAAGRLTSRTDPLGNVTRLVYDAAGNPTAVYDALGNEILQISYDARNLPIAITDALGRKTAAAYDALKNLTQVTDPLGKSAAYGYDGMNRLAQATDPLGLASTQAYDSDGNRVSLANPAKAATVFAYDKADRLTALTTAAGRSSTYSYDPRSLLSKIVDPTGNATTLSFDSADRMAKTVDTLSEIDYAYDAKSRLLTVTESGKTISRVYDARDRLTKFTDANGNVLQYTYDANDNLTTLTYPDGKNVTYAYDADNRLITVTDWAARSTKYSYDADGRLIKTARPNNTVQTLAYDVAGQLTSLADLASDGSAIVQYAYAYDTDGRLLTETRSPVVPPYVPTLTSMAYDADDRLTSYAGQTVNYNPNGDALATPLSGTLTSLTYDARDRLTAAAGITCAYDAENRRVQSNSSSGPTTYVVNPNAPLSQLLLSIAPSGSTTRNVYGLGLIYQDTDGTTVRYLHTDFRGSTVALTQAAGTVTGRVEYGPFGEIASQTGDTETSFLYVGQTGVETDGNGLLYMRARYYAPLVRRFLRQDVLVGNPVAMDLNRYAYVNDSPIEFADPLGLFRWVDGTIAAAGIVGNAGGLILAAGLEGGSAGLASPVVAAIVLRSTYGIVASGYNLASAFNDQEPGTTGSLIPDVVKAIAPENNSANGLAVVLDIAADLGTSAGATTLLKESDVALRSFRGLPAPWATTKTAASLGFNGIAELGDKLQYVGWADSVLSAALFQRYSRFKTQLDGYFDGLFGLNQPAPNSQSSASGGIEK